MSVPMRPSNSAVAAIFDGALDEVWLGAKALALLRARRETNAVFMVVIEMDK